MIVLLGLPLLFYLKLCCASVLHGDHICLNEVTVPQTTHQWELKNKTLRTYKWCLNVPPRCSVYTYKVVNETRVLVTNITKTIETCCEGFIEEYGFCVSQCNSCKNGLCLKGNCICHHGWDGSNCDIPKDYTFFTTEANNELSSTESTRHKETSSSTPLPTTTVSTTTIYEPFTTNSSFNEPSSLAPFSTENTDSSLSSPTPPSSSAILPEASKPNPSTDPTLFDTTATQPTDVTSTDPTTSLFSTKLPPPLGVPELDIDYRELGGVSLEDLGDTNSILDTQVFEATTLRTSPVLDKPSIVVQDFFDENSSFENHNQKAVQTVDEPAPNSLLYSLWAAVVTTALIIVVALTCFAVRNAKKKLERSNNKKDVATVAVYTTTSIFHTPLPELPTFDNPTYLSTGTSEPIKEPISADIQDFNVVFQKPLRNPKLDSKQLFLYDHPPSTGSYRASSEVDTLSQYNVSTRSASGIITEPVYDEIPSRDFQLEAVPTDLFENVSVPQSWRRSNADNNCLYMNTCGRTKF